jgi:hypothetical protein
MNSENHVFHLIISNQTLVLIFYKCNLTLVFFQILRSHKCSDKGRVPVFIVLTMTLS